MSTESIARSVIASAESAPEARPSTLSTPEESNAHEYADVAGQEFDHYIADDPQSVSRRAAAAAMTTLDHRPFVSTKQGMVRRQHSDDGNATRRTAREMVDLFAWGEGQKADPRDKAAMVARDFANGVLAAEMADPLPADASPDQIIDAIIAHGRSQQ